ncbi:ARM repeat-containing protein [Auricularia subglabra TFB-10046 SS5]|nr:ARM repeat-containing protein [Auricularia subglabra TFB-10046 SS5]
MEYLSSGALNREHFALVNKVEEAASPQQADAYLVEEVDVVRRRLARRTSLSPAKCSDALILLLYCVTASTIAPTHSDVQFALTHAVNLAEAGATLRQRRTGYLFCESVMPKGHELLLMLVNTIRKDLESNDERRICIGLEALVSLPRDDDVVPAVQDDLIHLVSHNSPGVRQRALHATRALQLPYTTALAHVLTVRLNEGNPAVVRAALSLANDLVLRKEAPAEETARSACDILRMRLPKEVGSVVAIAALQLLRIAIPDTHGEGLVDDILQTVLEALQLSASATKESVHPTTLECFRTLGVLPVPTLARGLHASGHPLRRIRHLLMAQDPNTHYQFLACLRELHPDLWAGTGETNIQPILDELDVQAIMRFLDADDPAIRSMTHHVLNAVDSQIMHAYVENIERHLTLRDERTALRVLEAARVLDTDGESYARRVGSILARIEPSSKGKGRASATASPTPSASSRGGSSKRRPPIVMESIVEAILLHLRDAGSTFGATFTTTLLDGALLSGSPCGPTLTLVIAAVACEYGRTTALTPREIACAMASRLALNSPAIQEALLLSTLRVVADCDVTPDDVTREVRELASVAGRHIRHRCGQFLSLAADLPALRSKVDNAKSSSLPDFLMAIESAPSALSPPQSPPPRAVKTFTPPPQPAIELPKATSKLRYAAYDPPPPVQPMRRQSTSSSLSSTSSSDAPVPVPRLDVDDLLSRTLTAGDLTLVAQDVDLRRSSVSPPEQDNLASRMNLIALDSPFYTEPVVADKVEAPASPRPSQTASQPDTMSEADFEKAWGAIIGAKTSARGWCESGPTEVYERIRASPHPFHLAPSENGRFRIAFMDNGACIAALRLRPGDDGVCLWTLRSTNAELKDALEAILDM